MKRVCSVLSFFFLQLFARPRFIRVKYFSERFPVFPHCENREGKELESCFIMKFKILFSKFCRS
jgi:hypothetical protein